MSDFHTSDHQLATWLLEGLLQEHKDLVEQVELGTEPHAWSTAEIFLWAPGSSLVAGSHLGCFDAAIDVARMFINYLNYRG